MDLDEIIYLLKEYNTKSHPKEWENTVSLTYEILTSFNKINQMKIDKKLLEDEKHITNQNISPKIKEYCEERERLHKSIENKTEKLNAFKELNDSLSNDLITIKSQVRVLKNEVTGLELKKSELKSQNHHLKKIEKAENIEKNQHILDKKLKKLQKLNKKEEKYIELNQKLEKRRISIEKAPKRKELETIDLVAYEAPIPTGLRKNSLIISDDSTSHSKDDDDSSDFFEISFNINRMSLKKTITNSNTSSIRTIKFANTKPLIATGNECGDIVVTKYSHEQLKKSSQFSFRNYDVISVDFSPNDQHFLACCSDLVIRLYKTKGWTLLNENDHFKKRINHAEFFNSSHKYVSCGKDNKIKIYDINKSKSIAKIKAPNHPYYVSSTIGNHQLLSGQSDSSVLLWDTRSGKQAGSFKFNIGKVIQVLAIPDSSTVVSLSLNKQICVTDLRSFSLIGKINASCTNFDSYKTRMALKDNLVVLGGNNGSVYSWSLKTFHLVSQKILCNNKIHVVDIKHDQNMIAIGDSAGNTLICY